MPVTIKDVAKKANVSISTVSRVINSSKPVSEDIKKRVYEVIEELGYSPNPVARSLVMKKTKLIGVIVPDISRAFVGELLNAIEDIAKTYAYDIVLCNTYGETATEKRYVDLLQAKQAEGIVYVTRQIDDINRQLLSESKVPIVLINLDGTAYDVLSVTIDQERSTYDMISYLLSIGHRKIGLIRSGDDSQSYGVQQRKGYNRALAEYGVDYDESLIFDSNYNLEQVYQIVDNLIKSGTAPSALFVASDDMAISAMNAVVDNHLKVPDDISVCGAHNSKIATLYRPRLTTVKHPIYDMGAIALRLMIKAINGQMPKDKLVVLPHEIIVRESTRSL